MIRRILSFSLLVATVFVLCACNGPSQTPEPPSGYDPTIYISFMTESERIALETDATKIETRLSNGGTLDVTVRSGFAVRKDGETVATGTMNGFLLSSRTVYPITFDLTGLTLPYGDLELVLTYDWTLDGESGTAELLLDVLRKPPAESQGSSDVDLNAVLKTPLDQLNQKEEQALAQYLFEHYIPCSYGIFGTTAELSSASVWSSVEALTRTIDKDTSEESRKLENVLTKVAIFFPGANFKAEEVRVYDADTKTFYESPAVTEEYEMLSYEIKNGAMTVYYQDKPDANDPNAEPVQYATTLQPSETEGYFSFVSSVRTGAVG